MSTDCLVLYIEEVSPVKYNANGDAKSLFIIYDLLSSRFFLCGKGNPVDQDIHMNEYSFYCESDKLESMVTFIEMNNEDINISLYNYDFLPDTCDDIKYDDLHYGKTSDNWIATTWSGTNNRANLMSFFKMLKDIKNDYSL